MSFDLANLPCEFPRKFVPATADLGEWSQIEPLFDQLDARELKTTADLERWLLDRSELASAIGEEGSVRYIRMTCQTDDPEREKAFLHYVEQIEPKLKPRFDRLNKKFVACPARAKLPQERYHVFDRSVENRVALFREMNVPLETEEAKLCQQYQKLTGAQTVNFDGREQTLPQMAKVQEEPDRARRQQAWELVAERRLRDRDSLNKFFDDLFALRQRIARNAGFANYMEFAFRDRERFDYTPNDCLDFQSAVQKHLVPLARKLQEQRQKKLGVSPLRPWDLAVDPENKPPLKPFTESRVLIDRCTEIFDKLDTKLATDFRRMAKLDLLDLDNRKGKAPGGYQSNLTERRLPFIFMNAVGLDRDVRVLLHEAGHAFHSWECRNEPLAEYRGAPLEFCEVASMSMELLANPHLDAFYDPADVERSRREHLEGIVKFFPWCATIDAFQHTLYMQPQMKVEQREELWLALHKCFGGIESWEGYEPALRSSWHRQLHLFTNPFYYIEYGIAQLGALGIWQQSLRDPAAAVRSYRRALALGGSRPLPELFAAAGLRFDFGEKTIAAIADTLGKELAL